MNKLLNKPIKAFSVYALVVLLFSIPVYNLVVNHIWMEELDEHNEIIKERINKQFYNTKTDENDLSEILKHWQILEPGTKLILTSNRSIEKDSFYTISRPDKFYNREETERFRGLSAFIPINSRIYRLSVETSVEEVNETLSAIALVTFMFFSILVIGFIILNRQISTKIWKPFKDTLERLRSYELAKVETIQFKKTDIEEFEELNEALRKLIDKSNSVYKNQKMFIENASHELQTPLAVLKSKFELFLQNEHLTEKQFELLNSINLPLARVSRINKNLLLLAKIENKQFSETENIQIYSLLKENMELLSDYIEAKDIKVTISSVHEFSLIGNKTLFEILLNNLLINAIVHNYNKGEINIDFSEKGLVFSNTGESSLKKENLFTRFLTSSSKTTGSGLGLAITKEICERHGWKLDYSFKKNFHIFSVYF